MPSPAPDTALAAYMALLIEDDVTERDPVQVLRWVRAAHAGLRLYESEVAQAAHEQGRSWGDIGREIGMTKQAARRRYVEGVGA